jgi:protein-disulfide isomerase
VCKRAADPIKQLAFDFPDQVKVVVRNNALPMHARSQATALAALAAGNQGKYWAYYDRLWANPGARDDASLLRIAQALALDLDRWKKDIADPASSARVRAESDAALRLGAMGTPGFFVNGMRQVGWGSFRDLHDRVQREIAAGAQLAASGTPAKAIAEARIRQTAERNPKGDGEAAPDVDDWVKVLLAP